MTKYSWTGLSGDWNTSADWTPPAVPGAGDNANVTVVGTYTLGVAASESVAAATVFVNNSNATLQVDGTLSTGALTLRTGNLFLDGTLTGGTLALGRGVGTVFAGGTLAGETVNGTLSVGDNGSLNVTGGLTVNSGSGRGIININGPTSSVLNVTDSETLSAVTINIGSNGGADELIASGASLALASSVVIKATGSNGLLLDGTAAVSNAGTIVANNNGGSDSIATGSFANTGSIAVSSGAIFSISAQDGNLDNAGRISVTTGGSLDIGGAGTVSDTGTLAIVGNGTLELGEAVAATQNITFGGSGGLLVLDNAQTEAATIASFGNGDLIDILGAGLQGTTVTTTNNGTGGAIATLDGALSATLNFSGNFTNRAFGLVSDNNGSSYLIVGKLFTAGSNAVFSASTGNAIVNFTGANNTFVLGNGNAVINAGTDGAVIRAGNGNVVLNLAGNGNYANIGSGSDLVQGTINNSDVRFADGNDQIVLTGTSNVVFGGNGNNSITVTGDSNTLTTGTGANQITISGNNDVVNLSGTASQVSLSGTGDVTFLGTSSATVSDSGVNLNVVVGNGAGNSVITGVANDPTFALDITGGAGGFTTSQAVVNALQSDNKGGTELVLGTGTIDFAGVAANTLTTQNFVIVQHA